MSSVNEIEEAVLRLSVAELAAFGRGLLNLMLRRGIAVNGNLVLADFRSSYGVTQDVMTPGINERCVLLESGVASSSSLNVRDRFGDLPFYAVLVGKVRQVSKQQQRSGRLLGRWLDGFRLFKCSTDNRQRISQIGRASCRESV